jgi:hypothetical protein
MEEAVKAHPGACANPHTAQRPHGGPMRNISRRGHTAAAIVNLQQLAGNRAVSAYLAVQRCGSVPAEHCPCHGGTQPEATHSAPPVQTASSSLNGVRDDMAALKLPVAEENTAAVPAAMNIQDQGMSQVSLGVERVAQGAAITEAKGSSPALSHQQITVARQDLDAGVPTDAGVPPTAGVATDAGAPTNADAARGPTAAGEISAVIPRSSRGPAMICSKRLNAPVVGALFNHAYIDDTGSGDCRGNNLVGNYAVQNLIIGSWSDGCAEKTETSDDPQSYEPNVKRCDPKSGVSDVHRCLRDSFNAYANPNEYSSSPFRLPMGPNSNTFAATLAKACCANSSDSGLGWVPGWNHAPAGPCHLMPDGDIADASAPMKATGSEQV